MPAGARDGTDAGRPTAETGLGASLRAWRERALLTQEQLAARAGLNVRTVRRLETGELRRPRSASVRLLAEALDLGEADLATLKRLAAGPPRAPRRTRVPPHQLPADVTAFVGRTRELALIGAPDTTGTADATGTADTDAAGIAGIAGTTGTAGTVMVTAIDGMAGIGKTALAVHAAHRVAAHFPDGDLFMDLHGHTQGVPAAEPAQTLARLLEALGFPGEAIPLDTGDRAALYRSILADRKMLIVLDNAADEAQVRPLLPGAGGSLVLITSRRRLVGLDEARTISVDVLPVAEAIALFTGTAGEERVAGASREVLADVVRRCGLLPLAIRLAAARLKAHPAWSVRHLLERLEEHQRLLSELHAGRRSIAAALDLSYRELSAAEQRAYRLLALHPGTDIAAGAAAALLATPAARATVTLDRLLEAHLLQEPNPGRYRCHDLIRAHGAERVAGEPEADRRAAMTRLLDHYGRAASAAMDLLYPYDPGTRPRRSSGESVPGATPGATMPGVAASGGAALDVFMPDADAATAWLDAELPNLLALAQYAADHGFPGHLQHLSATLHRCLRGRGRYAEAESLHARALSAARDLGDDAGEMEALLQLGEIRSVSSRYEAAVADTTDALRIARAIGDEAGELRALSGLGVSTGSRGRFPEALAYYTRAMEIARTIGHRTGELDALIGFGNAHRAMGEREQAARALTRALEIARVTGHRIGELRALNGLGRIHLAAGDHGAAAACLGRALDLARATGHRLGELSGLTALGLLHRGQGRLEAAVDCYRRVLEIAREIGNRNWQFEAIHGLGRLHHDLGRPGEALESHRTALALASDLGQRGDQARAHDGLACAAAALGRPDLARHHWSAALAILTGLGADRAEESGVDAETIRARLAEVTPEVIPRTGR
ncbi:tetratricopeptide repeat protein [Nonomuraea fuscirosea]|uniref:ATP-binding protein n=1 Tax=Nonomuraea fuscirosea TaxID=1291556 RepID=UPI002DDAC21F|nr:tetratricopeptide repeat protein [Nonomuraea fuscirosea]WSA53900.1 tetratricopeptide repeat protein [Nonomuraea fuscirosea]